MKIIRLLVPEFGVMDRFRLPPLSVMLPLKVTMQLPATPLMTVALPASTMSFVAVIVPTEMKPREAPLASTIWPVPSAFAEVLATR